MDRSKMSRTNQTRIAAYPLWKRVAEFEAEVKKGR